MEYQKLTKSKLLEVCESLGMKIEKSKNIPLQQKKKQ